MKKIFFTCLSVLLFTASLQAQSWSELGTGSNALYVASVFGISNICTDPSGNVYAAAYDTAYGGPYVYKWNGTSWSILGGSNTNFNGEIFTLCSDANGNIYAGGEFTNSDSNWYYGGHPYIAKWDGTSWSQVGNAFDSYVMSLCFDKYGNMYAALLDSVVKLVDTTWSELGTGSNALYLNSNLNAICVDTNDNVYVAGAFTDGDSVSQGNLYVAKWNGTSWSELGNGVCAQWEAMDNQIFALTADQQGNIYVGGILHYGPIQGGTGNQYYGVTQWNGTAWNVINYGSNSYQFCLDPMGNLYAPLNDTTTGTMYVGKWNGTSWTELGTGNNALNANGGITTIASDAHGNIYTAGFFTDTSITYPVDTADLGNVGPPYYEHPCYVAKYTNPTTGIPVHEIVGVTVYPNPAKDKVNITTQAVGYTYTLMSITGVSLTSGALQQGNNSVLLDGFAVGMYILEMKDSNGQVSVARVVKE